MNWPSSNPTFLNHDLAWDIYPTPGKSTAALCLQGDKVSTPKYALKLEAANCYQ